MEPRVDVLTLGVGDLERALAFYRAVGLSSTGVIGTQYVGDETTPAGAAAMFKLRRGLLLMLYPRSELAKDANRPLEPATGAFSIGHFVSSRAEGDEVLDGAEAAGATLTDEAQERRWGIYTGYLRDPVRILWV